MKKVFFTLLGSFVAVAASASVQNDVKLKLNCQADLLSNGETETLKAESLPFTLRQLGSVQSTVKLELAPYTLFADMMFSSAGGSLGAEPTTLTLEPTLSMNFFKDGNPLQGSLNSVDVRGLELESRPLDKPLKLYGRAFIDAEHSGKHVSRVDYYCSFTRVK